MFIRILLRCSFLLPAVVICAQAAAQRARQLSVISENDNYALRRTDHYYTNGLMLRYVQVAKAHKTLSKKLLTAEAGQLIFTPFTFNKHFEKFMDRPFTGFLYARAAKTYFLKSGTVLQWGGLLGVVGKAALGKEVQRFHHRIFGLHYPHGWETGLKTAVGFNMQGSVAQPLLSLGGQQFGLRLLAKGEAEAGILCTKAAAGFLLRIGAGPPPASSAAFDAGIGPGALAKTEWYFFADPQLIAQGHNATLQGGLGQKTKNKYTTTPNRRIYQQSIGFVWAPPKWMVKLALTHKTKEAATMRAAEAWGTIAVGFKW